MNDKVVSLADHKASKAKWFSGPATCLYCKHKWEGVAEAGTHQLECPSCGLHKGVYNALASSGDDDYVWKCNCGNIYYEARQDGLLCLMCAMCHPYENLKF